MSEKGTSTSYRYCGREFSGEEIDTIRSLIREHPEHSRAELSRQVCDLLQWRRQDGRRKDMSCRVAMLRMENDGLLSLPPPRNSNGNGRIRPRATARTDPRPDVCLAARCFGQLRFDPVRTRAESRLWNELIERYHYLGYQPLPGAQVRYQVYSAAECTEEMGLPHLLAALGFGAAAWKVAPRDQFIGWTAAQRQDNLHLVVNNARFLILPWIQSRNLASRILSGISKQLASDWQSQYGYSPVLLETFVDSERFHGTAYRAANWILLGQTQGRGKLDSKHLHSLPVKLVFVFPLVKSFRLSLSPS